MTSIRSCIVAPVFVAAGFVGALLDSIPCPPPDGAADPGASPSGEPS